MMQIKDRLPDLKKKLPNENSTTDNNQEEEEDKVDDVVFISKPHITPVRNLLNKYLGIYNQFNDIRVNMEQLESMVMAKNIHKFDQKEFDKLRRNSLQISNSVIKKFKKLESKLPESDDFSTLARMKILLYHGFFHEYINLWTRNEKFLLEYEETMRKKLKMQSQILNCNLSDDDIETMMENKNTNLFMSNILQDTEAERKTLEEIKDRFEDLKKLEKSIAEVHNLFISLQALVAEQGEKMQRIETHFDATRHYVEEAYKNVTMAHQIKKSRCCLFRLCV